ncbi:hypothetical protein GOV05_01135 [Candidatus Woesearchaeota archaeon]|nr:hypothetical protein [Candidatus Woesearchaeota archaeon]
MKTPELETISLFSKDLTLNLTINQISKELKKSYAFTNKYVREFLDKGILSKKIVGSAVLCSLNYSNEKTLGLLMLNSIEDKTQFLKKIDASTKKVVGLLKEAPGLLSLFITKNEYFLVCEDKERANTYLSKIGGAAKPKITLLEKNEFKIGFRSINLKNTIIMEGYEKFWKLISEMLT